jgi:carboxymethylenebutenolidase
VSEKEIEIGMADGVCDAVLYEPEPGLRRPGVIHHPDIMGIRPSHRAMAQQLADAGYTVMLVNPFYRTIRGKTFDFPPNFAGDPRTMQRFAELTAPLTPEAIAADAETYVNYLATQPSVLPAKMGAVGYCYTGQTALRTAARRPDRIGAIASFHGGRLFLEGPDSPHLVLPRIPKSNGPQLYFAHAVKDHSMPAEMIEKFDAALKAWGGRYESEIYADALHGFTVPEEKSPVYNKPQADRAFGKMTALFAAALR